MVRVPVHAGNVNNIPLSFVYRSFSLFAHLEQTCKAQQSLPPLKQQQVVSIAWLSSQRCQLVVFGP